jgi:hypothetical protein
VSTCDAAGQPGSCCDVVVASYGAVGSTALPEKVHPPGTEDRIYGQWLKLKEVHVSLRDIGISVSDEGERTLTNVVTLKEPAVKT